MNKLKYLFTAVFALSAFGLSAQSNYVGPQVVNPATECNKPPSDAIVLFDGKNFNEWQSVGGGNVKWKIENGAMTVTKGGGSIETRSSFGDIQFHIEWRIPANVEGEGQNKGNSGIHFQRLYEVQILDCYNNENPTYVDGTAGSIYTQSAPLVNACRKAGEWQSYDVIYMAPRFNADGTVAIPARMTVFQNGVLVQNNFNLKGTTYDKSGYKPHGKLPLQLQDHGTAISFRNIWLRELSPDSNFGGVQVGTITYSYRDMPDKSLEATLNYALQSGLSSVELMGGTVESFAGIPAQNQKEWRTKVSMGKFRQIKRMFDAKGVKINILKLETFGSPEEIDYAFRVCKTLGAIGITTEVSLETAKRVAPFAEKHGLYLIFHNHCQAGDPGFSYDPIFAVSNSIKLNFDAGHYFGVTGKNPCDFIRQNHDRIVSLHLKDKTGPTAADACGVNKPWGQGATPIKEILQLLKKEKYPIEVDIELEYNVPKDSNPVLEVAKCVQYCKEALK